MAASTTESMTVDSLAVNLVDQYRIEQQVAVKAYTDQFLAYDVDEDRVVMLEVLRENGAPPGFSAAFVNRARVIAQVRHPNITRIFTVGRTATEQPYIAAAALDAYPLSQRLQQFDARPGSVNAIYALKLVRQLADALLLATRLDLLHYDLRPQNVMLKNVALPTDDVLVLSDLTVPFVRKHWDEPVATAELVEYLSPEQRAGKEIDASSHVYTLGVLAYHLLASAPPQGPTTSFSVLLRRLSGSGTALERIRPGLAPETYELVDHALRHDPHQRYESIDAFVLALEQALLAEELLVSSAQLPAVASSRRAWGMLTLVVLIALGTVAALTGARLAGNRAVPPQSALAAATTVVDSESIAALPGESLATDSGNSNGDEAPTTPATEPTQNAAAVVVPPAETATPTEFPSATWTATATEQATLTATPSATKTPLPPTATLEPRVRVLLNSVFLRRGPGTNYGQLDTLAQGEEVSVTARFGEGDTGWFEVRTAEGVVGWLSASVVQLVGELALLSVPTASAIPPTPTPTATPTATATPVIIATETPAGAGGNDGGGSVQPPAPTQPPQEPTRTPPPFPSP